MESDKFKLFQKNINICDKLNLATQFNKKLS